MDCAQLIGKICEIQKGVTFVKNLYVLEKDLILDYITIFAHTKDKYAKLIALAKGIGEEVGEHNGLIFKLKKPLKFENGTLKIFRIRKPDKARPQVGCGDFIVRNYSVFKKKYFGKKNFLLFNRENIEFLGLHDLSKNYLVYFSNKSFSKQLIV